MTPYAARLDKLRAACGSQDRTLLDSVIRKCGRDFEQFDEMGENLVEYHDDAEPITMREALEHLIMGGGYNPRAGFLYGFGLQFLCQTIGTTLPHDHWCSLRGWSWFPEVDDTLTALGVPEERLRVRVHLIGRGSPVPIPPIEADEAPSIGYLTLDEIKAVGETFDEAKVLAIGDEPMREGLSEVLAWFRRCLKTKRDLVCFHS